MIAALKQGREHFKVYIAGVPSWASQSQIHTIIASQRNSNKSQALIYTSRLSEVTKIRAARSGLICSNNKHNQVIGIFFDQRPQSAL